MIIHNDIEALLQEGINFHIAGNLVEAENRYLAILARNPTYPFSAHLLGELALQSGKLHSAEAWFNQAIASHPEYAIFHVSLGNAKLAMEHLNEASSCYMAALNLDPRTADAYYGLGLVARQHDELGLAMSHFKMARAIQPDHVLVHYNLGLLMQESGDLDAAALAYQTAIRLQPNFLEAYVNLGGVLQDLRLLEQAESCYLAALQFQPDSVKTLVNLGNVLSEQGRLEEACSAYDTALTLQPDNCDTHNNLANLLKRQGKLSAAKMHYEQALLIKPDSPQALTNLAQLLKDQGQIDAAILNFQAALIADADFYEAHYALANCLKDTGALDEARLHYAHALRCRASDCLRIRVATLLPPIYGSLAEMQQYRADMASHIESLLSQELAPCNPVAHGGNNNFYLVYQGENDKDIQNKLASLYRKVYQPAQRVLFQRSDIKNKIRIGFVSAFFRQHTIGELNRGIIANLSRNLFEVHVFSIGFHDDAIASLIRQQADVYHASPSDDLAGIESEIARQELDILFYTDIGMEPVSYFLAMSRLAPVQCVTWGHPVTTGIDTVDYYISSINQETPESDSHYSEKLVRMASLPMFYYPPQMPEKLKTRDDFGIPAHRHVYLCPQSLFKLHPDFDPVIAAILRQDAQGEIVLFQGQCQSWSDALFERFNRVMPDVVGRIRLLPRQGFADYMNLLAVSDVMLDPWHFGGGKTTLDALSTGLPVITLPCRYMRGRATYACYQKMDILDCVAATMDEYVAKAVLLASNRELRDEIARKIMKRRHSLCEDIGLVRELEQFFMSACALVGMSE